MHDITVRHEIQNLMKEDGEVYVLIVKDRSMDRQTHKHRDGATDMRDRVAWTDGWTDVQTEKWTEDTLLRRQTDGQTEKNRHITGQTDSQK